MPTRPPGHAESYRHQAEQVRRQTRKESGDVEFFHRQAWQALRIAVLSREPLCRQCQAPATQIDHITPRRLIPRHQWLDRANLQPLCARCHTKKTRAGQ